MPAPFAPITIEQAIQASIAPGVMLTGEVLLVSVFAQRLGRVVDRTRALLRDLPHADDDARGQLTRELETNDQRVRVTNRAIAAATASVLLIALLITLLFLAALLGWHVEVVAALLFIAAMGGLVTAMLCFLQEIRLSALALHVSVGSRVRALRETAGTAVDVR